MDVTRVVADVLGDVGQKGDDVMVGGFFDLFDASGVEARISFDTFDRVIWYFTELREGFAGENLELEPLLELALLGPDAAHLGEGVTFDHRRATRAFAPIVTGGTAFIICPTAFLRA
jgi:hypothetical protein